LEFLREQRLIHKPARANSFFACAGAGHHATLVHLPVCGNHGLVVELGEPPGPEFEGFPPGYELTTEDI
jgi:Fe2+ or Zn2+ uptake regulation protein